MRDDIRTYLMANRATQSVTEFSDQESLLESGVIDSMAMVDLISHLESEYSIEIDEDDMVPENFDTVDAIVAYLESKRGESAS